ncbi:MAG: hypothetical protein NTW19_12505 [Planctomycetota bacterium]|nr:hypothetical protein [Planctomycetota bacterium]
MNQASSPTTSPRSTSSLAWGLARRAASRLTRAAALFALGLAGLACVAPAQADERRFTFVYETTTTPPGAFEFENWITWKSHKNEDPSYDRFEFRHEVEFGLTDRLMASVYVANWSYTDGKSVDGDGVNYDSSGFELIYNLLNPAKDPFGLAVYGEYNGGPDLHALETKVLVQKNIDRWVLAYNVSLEAAWEQEDGLWNTECEFQQTVGVSYEVCPKFTLGVELLHQVDFPHWSEQEEHQLYAGPNMSYRAGSWWVTVTPLIQVTSNHAEPDFQTRLIAGINF